MAYSFYISFSTYIPDAMDGSFCIFIDGKGEHGFFIKEELKVQLQLQDESCQVILIIGKTKVGGSQNVEIVGNGYKSSDEAENSWEKIREILIVAFSRCRIPAGFLSLPTTRVLSIYYKDELGEKVGFQACENELSIYESAPIAISIPVKMMFFPCLHVDKFIDTFKLSRSLTRNLTGKEFLSYELFNTALFQRNKNIQFLTLIMAIEALIECKPRSDEARTHVKMMMKLTKDCSAVSDEDRKSMGGSLDWLKNESIGQAGRRIVEERLGKRMYAKMRAAKYLKECYEIRSGLVHKGKVDPDKFNKLYPPLLDFVSDLLTIPIIGSSDEVSTLNVSSIDWNAVVLDGSSDAV
jgi:hypothetical protein